MKTDFLKNIPAPILLRLKSIDLSVPSKNCHLAIDELLGRSVLLGGKRLRPLLTYLFADFFGVELNLVDIPARSIEMVHAASLSHDDVIDEATTRRGVASINVQASNKKAVLAGDYLLASVIGELCSSGNLKLVSEMAWVIEELASGEWIQSDALVDRKYSEEIIQQISLKKTSSVMSWCAISPAIIGNLSDSCVEDCRVFGHHLGLAFQYIDDTLDFSGSSQKDTHLDLQNGQVNSVVYDWLARNTDIKSRYENGEDIGSLFCMEDIGSSLDAIKLKAKHHLEECRKLVTKLRVHSSLSGKNLEEKESALLFVINSLESRQH